MIEFKEMNEEIKRIQDLMESKSNRSAEIDIANRLISGLDCSDKLWAEKVKIIGYLTTIETGGGTDSITVGDKLKQLIKDFPSLEMFVNEVASHLKNVACLPAKKN